MNDNGEGELSHEGQEKSLTRKLFNEKLCCRCISEQSTEMEDGEISPRRRKPRVSTHSPRRCKRKIEEREGEKERTNFSTDIIRNNPSRERSRSRVLPSSS